MSRRPRNPGGGVLPYVCILGMCRARDPHFQSWSSVPEHIIFTNYPKNPFRSITILHFLADFAVSETIIFKISLISTRSSPPTAGSAWTQSVRQRQPDASWQFRRFAFSRSKRIKLVPEPRIFTFKTAQARSGAPHFQAQNGSSSFRSPGPFFTLPRHIPTKIWGYPGPVTSTR